METLLELLRGYARGQHSYITLAEALNGQGYRNRQGEPFAKGSVEHVLSNRFYEGKVVYHPGQTDEEVREGTHEVPEDVSTLWLQCQDVKRKRTGPGQPNPKPESRVYPLTGVLVCELCDKPYHGEAVQRRSGLYRRMSHYLRSCRAEPRSINADALEGLFGQQVLGNIRLDEGWRTAVLRALAQEDQRPDATIEKKQIESGIANLRMQHLWGAVSDEEFKREFQALDGRRRSLEAQKQPYRTPNLDRAAALLNNLPELWSHKGVSDTQRRELVTEVFQEVRLRGHDVIAVAPTATYAVWTGAVMSGVGASGFEPPASASRTLRANRCATPRWLLL